MSVIVYIVEDNALKATSISNFFLQEHASTCRTTVLGSFQSALRAIEASTPDLIVLDMTLPTFDKKPNSREGRMRPLGGYDLMYKMKHRSIAADVIVVTQLETFGEGEEEISFLDITERCKRDFAEFFLGSVYYDQGGLNWQSNLAAFVQAFLSRANAK